jgi:hypothetical protein
LTDLCVTSMSTAFIQMIMVLMCPIVYSFSSIHFLGQVVGWSIIYRSSRFLYLLILGINQIFILILAVCSVVYVLHDIWFTLFCIGLIPTARWFALILQQITSNLTELFTLWSRNGCIRSFQKKCQREWVSDH